ncbi:MAG TPA: thioesterase family protein [Pedococcus sp.]
MRDAYPYWSQVPTRWNDNDVYGHVNNTVHYGAMDTVINRWMIEEGLLDVAHGDTIGLCVESGCRYLAPVEYPDVLAVGLRVARLGTSSVVWEAGILRDRDDLAVAEGRFVHVFVNRDTRRPRPLPEVVRAAMTPLLAPKR